MRSLRGSRTDWVVRFIERGLVIIGAVPAVGGGDGAVRDRLPGRAQGLAGTTGPLFRSSGGRAHRRCRDACWREAPIGRLEIRASLSVVVAEGDDDNTLKVAVGHLPDTPLPWQENTPPWQDTVTRSSAHFEAFNRVMKSLRDTADVRYRVTRHTVVEPDELWVLDASPAAALTLITLSVRLRWSCTAPIHRSHRTHGERERPPAHTATEGTRHDDRRAQGLVLATSWCEPAVPRVGLGTGTRDCSRGSRGPPVERYSPLERQTRCSRRPRR